MPNIKFHQVFARSWFIPGPGSSPSTLNLIQPWKWRCRWQHWITPRAKLLVLLLTCDLRPPSLLSTPQSPLAHFLTLQLHHHSLPNWHKVGIPKRGTGGFLCYFTQLGICMSSDKPVVEQDTSRHKSMFFSARSSFRIPPMAWALLMSASLYTGRGAPWQHIRSKNSRGSWAVESTNTIDIFLTVVLVVPVLFALEKWKDN